MTRRMEIEAREAIASIVVEEAPALVAAGIIALAEKETNSTTSAILTIMAEFVKHEGQSAITALHGEVAAMIDGDPMAAMRIAGDNRYDTARMLSDLTDALQNAEADDKARSTRLLRTLGVVLADLSKVVSSALIAAL